eukprot:Gb_09467 [translate_table: standard]
MEVVLSIENPNDGDRNYHQQEHENEPSSSTHNMEGLPVKTEETKQNDVVALWVKWRGKWQAGIQCSSDDCPSATLKAKPTYGRKHYIVVYFPQTRSHCWTDSQLVCPISEKPEPLAYGTHESGLELVKDLHTPRRYMMQNLAVSMLDASDQLHVEAVVESARNVNAWKEFAKEAGQCKNYSDLGRMLVKLHSMILEIYVSPTWMKNSFDLWKQQCENAQTAESTEILTKELINSVLWDDVARLWDAPVQPELGSDWKTWKEEGMKWFSTSNPPSTSDFDGECDRKSGEEHTDITNFEVSRKRPKLEIRRGETRASEVTDTGPSELQVHKEVIYSPFLNQQEMSSIGQGISFNNGEGISNSCPEGMAKTWNEVKESSGHQILPCTGGYREAPITEHELSSKNQLMGSEHRYRQCSAFMETKGRQCGRWANDGDIYCCMHLNFHSPDNARRMDQVESLPKTPICQGMTIYGRRCTHRCKNGSSFCLKHLLQDGQTVEADRTPNSSTIANNNKRVRLSVEGQPSERNATSAGECCKEISQNESKLNLTSGTHFQDLDEVSGSSAQRWSGVVDRHQRVEFLPHGFMATEKSAAKGPYQRTSWSRCIGWCRNNSGQCSHKAKPGSSYCEKHFPGSAGHGGKMNDRYVSSELLNKLLRSTSSEEEKMLLCRATDLLNEFMNVCLLEGTTYRSNSKGRVMDWIIGQVSKDVKAAEALLKMVSGEKEKLGKHLGVEEELEKCGTALVPWIHETQVQFSSAAAEDDGKAKSITETGMPDSGTVVKYAFSDAQMLSCKLCGEEFSDSQALGRHWIINHKKEAQCFFRGYACRACNSPFTNKRGLERHVKIHHAGSLLEHCILILCIHCGSHFMNYEMLWQHVVSAHSEEFIRSMGILEQVKDTQPLVHMEAKEGISNEVMVCENSKQEMSCKSGLFSVEKNQNHLTTHSGNTAKDKGFVNRNTVRRYTCRFCGLKFHLLPDLGRHHQAEHMATGSNNSNKFSLPNRGKGLFTAKWRANKGSSKLMQNVGSSVGLKRAAVIARKKCPERFELQSPTRTKVSSERPELSEKDDRTTEFYCSAVAEMLLSEVQKTRPGPNNLEILGIARSACCRFNLHAVLEEKYGTLPERLYIKAARLCSEANIRVEWHREDFICPRQCRRMEDSKPPVMLAPLPDVCLNPLPAELDDLRMVLGEIDTGDPWEKAESHLVLTSSDCERSHRQKTIVICEDLSFGREAVPVPCVLDEDVVDLKESNDLHMDTYMPWQNFSYITERLLDPSLGLDTKSSQLGCTCTQQQCFPESCDHVYLFDNDNDDAEDIYGQAMHGRFPYDENGRIILEEGFLVYECNSMCSCHKECPNRVLQKGVQVKLEVYKTKHKGWAVRAAQAIPRGTFICEYIGEVLNDQEANKRGERYDNEGCSYLYDIDAHINTTDLVEGVQPYVIDATKYGNVARFINHSCSPNLVNYQVLVESMDCQLAHIGLYASRDIAVGEELAYDYRYKLLPGEGCPCHCGATSCRGRLY